MQVQHSTAGVRTRLQKEEKHHDVHEEEEKVIGDDSSDEDEAYIFASDFFRGHPLLALVNPDADSPSAVVTEIIDEFLQAHPSSYKEDITVFVEALMDTVLGHE